MADSGKRPARVRALTEIALRVRDLDMMPQFYSDVIGLPLMMQFCRVRETHHCTDLMVRFTHSTCQ